MNASAKKEEITIFSSLSEIMTAAFYFEAIGVVYSICFFAGFGLNFADYAEIDDLILGSFKEPVVFVAAIGVVFYFIAKKSSAGSFGASIVLLLVPIALAATMAFVARYYIVELGKSLPFSNTGMEVQVLLSNELKFEGGGQNDREYSSLQILGKSGEYFFFFDNLTQDGGPWIKTIILPKASIVQIARANKKISNTNKK